MSVTRRDLIRKSAVGLTGAAAVSTGIIVSSEPTVAASGLTADDVSVSDTDGDITSLTVTPDITISWSNQNSQIKTVKLTWYVKTSSNSGTVGSTPYTFTVDTATTDGSISPDIPTIDLLSNNGGALSGSNFNAATEGDTTNTDVTISMDVQLLDSGDNVIVDRADLLGPKTFTVSVNHVAPASSVTASGTANTSGS